jgi:hypothetical protein
MLQNLDDQIRDCAERAADCAKYAKGVTDPRERSEWLSLHSRYLAIVDGIESRRRYRTFMGAHGGHAQSIGRRHDCG